MNTKVSMLSPLLRIVITVAAALNLLIGLLFLLGPELGFALWPSPLPREIMRFIGSIVLANGIGAAMIARRPTWENARVLVAVALVYGALIFLSLVFDLLAAGAPPVFWIYLVINTAFLLPAAYFFWRYEQPDPESLSNTTYVNVKRKPEMKWSVSLLILLNLLLSACGGAPPATTVPSEPTAEAAASPTAAEVQPTAAEATATAPAEGTAEPTAAAEAGTFTVLGVLNRDTTQAALSPSLIVDPASTDTSGLWTVWAENVAGGPRQIFSSEFEGDSFQARGASLNIHTNVAGDLPTITLSGETESVPWVAWVEPSPGFNDVVQVFASRFNAQTGLWQQAGQDRGGGEASLNLQTNRNASHPFIFSGSGDPTSPPVPWVAWEEPSINSNALQIFVSKGVKDDSGDAAVLGGFRWEPVGLLKASEPTLNVDPFRSSFHPTGVFAETNNAVPWVTWHEEGGDRPSRIFTARGVADANAPGGFKWINVPACQPNDETTCSLNINPLLDAKDASMAAGSLTPGESTVPWIAWPEIGQNGKWQIFVSRLDTASRNSFLQVGASLNVDPNQDARQPIITFVGNVPYVAWLEDDGTGKFQVQVRHLASDPQTGTWALDTPEGGFNLNLDVNDSGLAAAASDNALIMAWTEGDPESSASQIVIGALSVGSGQP